MYALSKDLSVKDTSCVTLYVPDMFISIMTSDLVLTLFVSNHPVKGVMTFSR